MKRFEIMFWFIVFLLSILLYIKSFNILPEAATYPQFLIIIIAIVSLIQIVSLIVKKEWLKKDNKKDVDFIIVIITMALTTLYAISIELIGFLIASIIYLVLTMKILKVQSTKVVIGVAIGVCLVTYISFIYLLKVPLV